MFPETPYDLKIVEKIQNLAYFFPEKEATVILAGLIAKILSEVLSPITPRFPPSYLLNY